MKSAREGRDALLASLTNEQWDHLYYAVLDLPALRQAVEARVADAEQQRKARESGPSIRRFTLLTPPPLKSGS